MVIFNEVCVCFGSVSEGGKQVSGFQPGLVLPDEKLRLPLLGARKHQSCQRDRDQPNCVHKAIPSQSACAVVLKQGDLRVWISGAGFSTELGPVRQILPAP